jgi:hypothetical protein
MLDQETSAKVQEGCVEAIERGLKHKMLCFGLLGWDLFKNKCVHEVDGRC